MDPARPEWFDRSLLALMGDAELTDGVRWTMFRELLSGRTDDVHAAALVIALRMKGETTADLATAAACLREQMVRLVPVRGPVLDTCGTGGDDSGTFNISTAAALVVAGTGVPVVKHGNRAVSSRSGSADVLRELGVPIEAGTDWAQRCLDRIGFAFCYAPHFHAALGPLSTVRRKLGIRSIFNLIGPLANPASADFHLLGVGDPERLDVLAGALVELGVQRAILVCGFDGLDEVSLATPTMVRIVEGGSYWAEEWDRDMFDLPAVDPADIKAESAAESARIIEGVLDGLEGPARSMVLANAAAALFAANAVRSVHEGVAKSSESIRSGAAKTILDRLRSSAPAP